MDEPRKNPSSAMHTISVAAVTPMVQALLTGLLLSIIAFAVSLTFHLDHPLLWLLWGFLLPTAGLWLFSVRRWFKLTNLITYAEKVTQLDINRDGQIGNPLHPEDASEPKQITITVRDVSDHGSLSVMRYDLPASESQLREFALGVGRDLSLAEANWIGPAHPFTRDEYRAFRAELVRRRWVELANHKSANQGFQMTRAGRAVMREIAKAYSPTPDVED